MMTAHLRLRSSSLIGFSLDMLMFRFCSIGHADYIDDQVNVNEQLMKLRLLSFSCFSRASHLPFVRLVLANAFFFILLCISD